MRIFVGKEIDGFEGRVEWEEGAEFYTWYSPYRGPTHRRYGRAEIERRIEHHLRTGWWREQTIPEMRVPEGL